MLTFECRHPDTRKSSADPEYASAGLTEAEARARYDCAVAVARYEDLLRPVAELQLAFPTFTEGVGMAAQMVVRDLGVHPMPQVWSSLSAPASWVP